jgi:hypothetical protein
MLRVTLGYGEPLSGYVGDTVALPMNHAVVGEVPKVPTLKVTKNHVHVIVECEPYMKRLRITRLNR